MEFIANQMDWAQKYRPQKLEDMILPTLLMRQLIKLRDSKQKVSLLLHGKAGTGKTTAARLLHHNYVEFNSSRDRGVAFADNIFRICSLASVYEGEGLRVVVLDEADYLTNEAQASLRNTIESLSSNNVFIFTANYPEKLSEAIHSRLMPINFSFENSNSEMKQQMLVRAKKILANEGLTADEKHVENIVSESFPDMRKVLKRMQFEIALAA